MATVKKTAAEQGLQQKMKVLAKLFDAGCKTEKDLKALTLPTILKIPDVTVPDMTVISPMWTQDTDSSRSAPALYHLPTSSPKTQSSTS